VGKEPVCWWRGKKRSSQRRTVRREEGGRRRPWVIPKRWKREISENRDHSYEHIRVEQEGLTVLSGEKGKGGQRFVKTHSKDKLKRGFLGRRKKKTN